MSKRPLIITVFSFLFIAIGVLGVLSDSLRVFSNMELPPTRLPIPYWAEVFVMYIGSFVILISGILLLKRNKSGRLLIIAWSVISMIIYSSSTLPRIIYLIVILTVLFLPRANEYFQGTRLALLKDNTSNPNL